MAELNNREKLAWVMGFASGRRQECIDDKPDRIPAAAKVARQALLEGGVDNPLALWGALGVYDDYAKENTR